MNKVICEFASFYLSTINNNFVDINTKNSMNFIAERYSLAKHGSIKDIKLFSKMIVETIFFEMGNSKSNFRETLSIAKKDNGLIVLMTPGYRNVKSFANIMFDIALHI
jgi:hypothetical protein